MADTIRKSHYFPGVLSAALLGPVLLSGCFSSSSSSDDEQAGGSYAITGELNGLGSGELVLDVNGEDVVLSEDGEAVLVDSIEAGRSFEINVAEAPSNPHQDCTPTPASGEVDSDIEVSLNCVTPVTVAGRLVAPDVGERDIDLTVGGQSHTVETDDDGDFRFELNVEDPRALIQLDWQDDFHHFRSHVGSAVGLAANNALSVQDEHNQIDEQVTGRVNLHHLNTAISGQLYWLNDGQAPEDHETLTALGREVLSQEAARVAGGLRMVSWGEASLPDYAGTTLEASEALDRVMEWVDGIDSGASSAAAGTEQTLSASSQGEPLKQPYEARPVLVGTASNGDLDGNTASALEEASVDDDGFTDVPASLYASSGFTWGYSLAVTKLDFLASEVWMRETNEIRANGIYSLSDGDLVLDFSDYDDPYYTDIYPCETEDGPSNDCVQARYFETVTFEKIMDGLAGDLVNRVNSIRVEHPDDVDEGTQYYENERLVSVMTKDDNVALDVNEVQGALGMPLPLDRYWGAHSSESLTGRIADILFLDDGGSGVLQLYQDDIVWDVRDDGQLEVRPSGASERWEAWLIQGDPDGEGVVLVDSVHNEEDSITGGVSMRRDDDLFMNGSDWEGRWMLWQDVELGDRNAFILDYDRSNDADIAYLGYKPESGLDEYFWIENQPWRFEFNGNSDQPRFTLAQCTENDNGDWTAVAVDEIAVPDDDTNSNCDQRYHVREWQPIREENGRVYVTERQRIWENPTGQGWELVNTAGSVRFYGYEGEAEH